MENMWKLILENMEQIVKNMILTIMVELLFMFLQVLQESHVL